MTRGTSFKLERAVFENERSLLFGVTFHTGLVRTYRKLCLFLIETAVRVMTIAAAHGALKHLMTKRLRELSFDLAVTAYAELRFAVLEHCPIRHIGTLSRGRADLSDRKRMLRCE